MGGKATQGDSEGALVVLREASLKNLDRNTLLLQQQGTALDPQPACGNRFSPSSLPVWLSAAREGQSLVRLML